LDQLEGRHCKDTQKCWPFCIGAPKGPFLQGLREIHLRTTIPPILSKSEISFSLLLSPAETGLANTVYKRNRI
jgi:hypothetical protein